MSDHGGKCLFDLADFVGVGRHGFVSRLHDDIPSGDANNAPYASSLRLFEDGVPLGPAHSLHADIIEKGHGRFSHWGDCLFLSTSDNSRPTENGRRYTVLIDMHDSTAARAASYFRSLGTESVEKDVYLAIEACLAEFYPKAKLGEDKKLFWEDRRLVDLYARLGNTNWRSFERKFAVFNLMKLTEGVAGDLAECGVYNGTTAYFMALSDADRGHSRAFHLFDSFEGVSRPTECDGSYWTKGDLSLPEETARNNLSEFDRLSFYKGWIPTRFAEVSERRFAFVHVDVDLFEPTKDSLAFFYERLEPDGLLVCDDYGFMTCPGATKAMDDFFADKPEQIIHLSTGQGFVMKI